MKDFKRIIFLSIIILLIGCNDDHKERDQEDIEVTGSLAQTRWKGVLYRAENTPYFERGSITLSFYTEETGEYDLKYDDDDYLHVCPIKYTLDTKLLSIKPVRGSDYEIKGEWFIANRTHEKLVLEQGSDANPLNKTTIMLEIIK